MPLQVRYPSCQSLTGKLKTLFSGTTTPTSPQPSSTEKSEFAFGNSISYCSQADSCHDDISRTEDDLLGLSEVYSTLGQLNEPASGKYNQNILTGAGDCFGPNNKSPSCLSKVSSLKTYEDELLDSWSQSVQEIDITSKELTQFDNNQFNNEKNKWTIGWEKKSKKLENTDFGKDLAVKDKSFAAIKRKTEKENSTNNNNQFRTGVGSSSDKVDQTKQPNSNLNEENYKKLENEENSKHGSNSFKLNQFQELMNDGINEEKFYFCLAESERTHSELMHQLQEITHDNQVLKSQLDIQLERNRQLIAETRECQFQAISRRSVENGLQQARQRLSQLERQLAHEEGSSFQLDAKLLNLREQNRRISEACLRLQISAATSAGHVQRIDSKIARLEYCRLTAKRCKRLFNKWQDLAGGMRVIVRISNVQFNLKKPAKNDKQKFFYNELVKSPSSCKNHSVCAKSTNDTSWMYYSNGCLIVPSPDEIGVLIRNLPNHKDSNKRSLSCNKSSNTLSKTEFNEQFENNNTHITQAIRLFQVNEVLYPGSPETDQLTDLARRTVGHLSGGKSAAVLCYGPRGTGKTHTCLYGAGNSLYDGLAALTVQALLLSIRMQTATWMNDCEGPGVSVSLIEVYNERVTCLLSRRDVQLRDDGRRMRVIGQLEKTIYRIEQFVELLRIAIVARRTVCLAGISPQASRSHMLMMLRCRPNSSFGSNGRNKSIRSNLQDNQSHCFSRQDHVSNYFLHNLSKRPQMHEQIWSTTQNLNKTNQKTNVTNKEEFVFAQDIEPEGTFLLADLAGYTTSGTGEESDNTSLLLTGGIFESCNNLAQSKQRPSRRSFSSGPVNLQSDTTRLFRTEASEINRSLSAFRQVLHCLREGERQVSAPFRDSKLTQLLKPCFSSETETTLLLNLTCDQQQHQATTSCLELGQIAMSLAFGQN